MNLRRAKALDIKYKFSETEINKLLKENFVILYDTREQQNQHILDYFDKSKLGYKKQKVDEGDYTAVITKREDMGIYRDIYFPVVIERKNSIDELAGNICEKKDDNRGNSRLERELDRAKTKGLMVFLLIEDKNGKQTILNEDYRSNISKKALEGKLESMQIEYLKGVIYTDKANAGREIVMKLYYGIRYFLKQGNLDISPINEIQTKA